MISATRTSRAVISDEAQPRLQMADDRLRHCARASESRRTSRKGSLPARAYHTYVQVRVRC
jgi:hypothetical protein